MKLITLQPAVDQEKCKACKTCVRICPVLALEIKDKILTVDLERCRGCAGCEQRCPEYAISMVLRDEPLIAQVDMEGLNYEEIADLCRQASFHPEQVVCYCTGTRADEVAAAIILGAKSPEDVSLMTGVRTGCKVECIEPILRLIEAAGIKPEPPPGGWQWYGRTVIASEIPEEVRKKYSSRGFYFDEDVELLQRVVNASLQGKE